MNQFNRFITMRTFKYFIASIATVHTKACNDRFANQNDTAFILTRH